MCILGPPHLPLVGSLPFMGGGDICEVFTRFRRKYGDLFTIYMGSTPVVVVCGYDNVKYLLLDKGNVTSDRPDTSFLVVHMQEGKGLSNPQTAEIFISIKKSNNIFIHNLINCRCRCKMWCRI